MTNKYDDVANAMNTKDLSIALLGEQKELMMEGGNMFPDASRINQENVAATMRYIYDEILPPLGINRKYVQPLGSTGKKLAGGSSGDIDLGIDATKCDFLEGITDTNEIVKTLCDHCKPILDGMGIESKMIPTLYSIKCPIQNFDGKQEGEFVQLDMMVTRDAKFQTWSQYAPKEIEGQKYFKGWVRNLILEATAHAMDDMKVIKTGYLKNGAEFVEAPVEWEEYSFYTQEGLNIKHVKLLPMAKQPEGAPGTVYKKTQGKDTDTRNLVTSDPDVIATKMFGPKVKGKDLLSWEGTWEAAHKSEWAKDPMKLKKFQEVLRQKFIVKMKSSGEDIPQVIKDELGIENTEPVLESTKVDEGGNRFETAGKINQDNFKATYDALVKLLKKEFKLDDDDFVTTGSGGKKLGGGETLDDGTYKPTSQSGDIDIAINKNKIKETMDIETLEEWIDAVEDMCQRNHLECATSDRWGWTGACSINMPIENVDGHQEGQFVQADLMPCDNLKYQAWSKYAPSEVKGEKYVKGLVRNAILRSIAKAIWFMGDERGKVNKKGDNEPLSWSRYQFDKEGLYKRHFKRDLMKGKKGEEGIHKGTPTELEKEFITDDPDELCEILCGVDSANMLTWQDAWKVAKKKGIFKHKDELDRFKENLEHELKYELDKGNLKYVPDEIAKFIDYDPATFVRRERHQDDEEPVSEAFKKRKSEVNATDTAKSSMTKIHQLQGTKLREFLSDFIQGFNDGKLLVKTTPKIDGAAFRIGWCDGQVYIENSRSGLQKADSKTLQIPISHRNVAKYVSTQDTDKIFSKISSMGLSGVKVIGELLSNGENIVDDDGSITYVGSSYNASKLGSIGSIVVFSAQQMTSSSLSDMNDDLQQEFINFLSDEVSDAKFSYFNLERFAQEIELNVNMLPQEVVNELKSTNPMEMDKTQAESLRDKLNASLTDIYKKQFKSPDIMMDGDTLEGVVLELNGKIYGIHYQSWKDIKTRNLGLSSDIDEVFGRMIGELVGMSPTVGMGKLLGKLRENKNEYSEKYKELRPKFQAQIDDIVKRGKDMEGMSKYAKALTKGKYDRFIKIIEDVPLTDDIDSLIQLVDGKVVDMNDQIIALIPGSFKPPHKGHFDMVKQYANKCDQVFVGISNPSATSSREDASGNDIPNFVSKEIFEIYAQAANINNVTFEVTKNPISWMRFKLQHIKNAKVMLGLSKKDDASRFSMFDNEQFKSRLNNVEILPIEENAVEPSKMEEGDAISATYLRTHITERDVLRKVMPNEINDDQFNKIYELLNNHDDVEKEQVNEGGHAIFVNKDGDEFTCSRINQENVAATLDDIYKRFVPLLGLDKEDVASVGSTGKRLPGKDSGDIDLAIDQKKLMERNGIETPEEFIDLCQEVGDKLNIGTSIDRKYGWKAVSYSYPIQNADGKQEGQMVQLDLVVSDDMEFTTWTNHSDQEEDGKEYVKSAIRNIIFNAIARGGHMEVLNRGEVKGEGDDAIIEMNRMDYDYKNGLFKVHRTRKMKKDGTYGGSWSVEKEFLTKRPDEIVHILYNDPSLNSSDIMSPKDAWDALMDSDLWNKPEVRKEIERCFTDEMARNPKLTTPAWINFN